MIYELAKELKDAGFPQEIRGGCEYWNNAGRLDIEIDDLGYPEKLPSSFTHNPTLSELIEACGEKFCRFTLQYLPNKHLSMHSWWATARDLDDNIYGLEDDTPEEAVAKLWLALNKK